MAMPELLLPLKFQATALQFISPIAIANEFSCVNVVPSVQMVVAMELSSINVAPTAPTAKATRVRKFARRQKRSHLSESCIGDVVMEIDGEGSTNGIVVDTTFPNDERFSSWLLAKIVSHEGLQIASKAIDNDATTQIRTQKEMV